MGDKHEYKYRFNDWKPGEWAFRFSEGGYHETASEICRDYDNDMQDFPDSRVITVQDMLHDTPRKFIVYAETVREYEANELLK